MMFTPVLLLKIGIQFNLLPEKRYEEKNLLFGKRNQKIIVVILFFIKKTKTTTYQSIKI